MEKIICEEMYFYNAGEACTNTFTMHIHLKEMVDGAVLRRSVDEVRRRYPYYAMVCVVDGERYVLEENSAPFAVQETESYPVLGSPEVGRHLMAFTYWGEEIRFHMFHGLTDGQGALEVVRTLLYYYCREKYDANLSDEGVRTNENVTEAILSEEWQNPYLEIMRGERDLPSFEDIVVQTKPRDMGRALNLLEEDARLHRCPAKYDLISIPEKEMMQYCRAQDGTPGVVISLLMSRAVDRLNPDNDKPIITGMAMSLRPALEEPRYKGSPLAMAFLPYTESIRHKAFDAQATIYRGRLLLASDKERLQAGINQSRQFYNAVFNTPTFREKKQLITGVFNRYLGTSTFQVSYVGQSKLQAMEPYVKAMSLTNDPVNNGMMIEVMVVDGTFYLEITREWEEPIYREAFCRELEEQNISYQVLASGNVAIPGIDLPQK